MSMHGSEKKDLSRKLTQHTLGEVLQELGVDNIEDDYQSSDEEKEDHSPHVAAVSQHMKPSLSRYQSNGFAVPVHTMPTSLPSSSFSQQRNSDSFYKKNGMQPPPPAPSHSFSRPVSRPSSFHHGSHKKPDVQHATVADYYDMSKLSEEEQVALTLKLSEQESKYGVNMLDVLKMVDPSEIADLEACGYNFGQAAEMIFNRRQNGSNHGSTRDDHNGWGGYRSTPPSSQPTSVKRTTSGIAAPSSYSPVASSESSSPAYIAQPQPERPLSLANVAFLDSFQKPNSLKSRRHSGILHHIEEKLGHSITPTPDADGSDDDIEHKASEPIPQSHSKSFMNSFQKPNALKDRRHSGIMHIIESKHQGDDVEYKADPPTNTSPAKQSLPPTSPEHHSRSFMDSFAKPNSLKERRQSGVFQQSQDGSKPSTPHGSAVKAPPPSTLSRDNSLSAEVSFTASSPHSPQHYHTDIMERRQSARTPPPPDAIHRVNLLDRKQSGIRGQHLRQNSQSTTEGIESWTDAIDNSDAVRPEPRRRGGTPPPADAVKTVNLLDRKHSGILFSRSRSNSLDVTDASPVPPTSSQQPQEAQQQQQQQPSSTTLRTGQSPVNLIDEMLDPSQMSEEDQIALSIKLSEQEARYGTNMLEELPRIDPSEIETLESFGYNFGQAVEIIFKEHHDVTQEVSLHADEAALVLPEDTMSTASGATFGTTENNHHGNNTNPLRRRPSNSDLYEGLQQVPSVDTASSYPSSLGYPSKSPSDAYRTLTQPNMRRPPAPGEGFSTAGGPPMPGSAGGAGGVTAPYNDGSLRRGGSQANLMAMMPSEEAGRSTRDLVRKSSLRLMDAANASNGSSNLPRGPPQRIPSQSTMNFDAQSVTSTQTIEALRYLPTGHPQSHQHQQSQQSQQYFEATSAHHYSAPMEQPQRPYSMHGQPSSFHRSSGPALDQYGYPVNPEAHASQPSSNELRRHSSHHQMMATSQQDYYHSPQQLSRPLPQPPQLQLQPPSVQHQPAVIDRRLSSSSHSYYDGDNSGRQGGVAVLSRSSSVNDERGSGSGGGGPRGIPVSAERGYGDPTSPAAYGRELPFLGHAYAPPPPVQPASTAAPQPPKTLTARPSVQNMIPVRVDAYFDVPSSSSASDYHQSHPSSTGTTTGVYRSASQEIHRSHSQSFYDQHRPPSQPLSSSQNGSYQPTPRSGGSHYTDPYSPNTGPNGGGGGNYGIYQTSYDSLDHHHGGRPLSSAQGYYPQANAPSPLQPSPSHPPQPQYSPTPGYRSMGPTAGRNGGGSSSSSSSSSVIDTMRSDALSQLSEDEQFHLSMLLSKQDEVHGVNMFDRLRSHDQPEIDYWLSLGYKFDKVALFLFQRHFDPRVTHPER